MVFPLSTSLKKFAYAVVGIVSELANAWLFVVVKLPIDVTGFNVGASLTGTTVTDAV